MTKTTPRKRTTAWRTTAVAAAMASAGLLLALTAMPREAEAVFPDENGRIAFASNRTTGEGVDNPTGDFEIFTMEPDGTGLVQLTNNTDFDFAPDWSANGRRIAFESDRDNFSEIFVMRADGKKQTRITTNPDFSFDRSPSFSPDGERIAFESNRAVGEGVDNPESDTEIFVQNLDGTDLKQLTHNDTREFDRQPDFSPDGEKIAFVSNRDQQSSVFTMNADGTAERRRSRGPATVFESPGWSPDNEEIVFMSNQDGPDEIHKMRRDGFAQKRLTDNGAPPRRRPHLLSRRKADSVRHQPGRQRRGLHDAPGRQGPAQPHQSPGGRLRSRLAAAEGTILGRMPDLLDVRGDAHGQQRFR